MNDQVGTKPLLRQASPPLSEAAAAFRQRRMSSRSRWLAVALMLLLAAGAATAWWSMRGATTIRYVTVPATRGTIARTVAATGTVNPELTIIVGSYVSGIIQQLYCDYNSKVKAGQSCAKIDPRPYQSQVDQDRANLAVAKAQLEKDKALLAYARLNYERTRRLAAHQFASQDAADLAESTYKQAQAQVGLDQATIEQRQAALDTAEVNLGYTDIVSPVDGTVVSRNVTQGQTVAASFQTPTLFLIATDLSRMQVDTNVSESDIGGIKEGDRANFTVDAFPGRVFAGTVTQVRQSPQMVQNVVTYDAVVSLTNPDQALKPGMTASTRIVIARRDDALRVPNQTLRYVPGGLAGAEASGALPTPAPTSPDRHARLWILRDGRPAPVAVTTGIEDENFTEIVNGDLHAGDPVVVGEERGPDGGATSLLPRP